MNRRNISLHSGMGSMKPRNEPSTPVIAFQDVPLTALGKETMRRLSCLLNSEKNFRSHDGYERDWRGLACLAKQKCLCDETAITLQDPITKLMQLWCINNPKTATFAYLEKFLAIIERWDVSDEIHENLMEDSEAYQMEQLLERNLKSLENITENHHMFDENFDHSTDKNILTIDDVLLAQKGLPPQIYDAFVLYADADLNRVSEMLTILEDQSEYSFKLCIKDRDLLAGVHMEEHVVLTQLIEERCKHFIVILTEEFLKSPEHNFLTNYTQALQLQNKAGNIIPVLYENSVNIPNTLEIYNHLRCTENLIDFWLKLANAMRNVNTTTGTTNTTSPTRNVNTAFRTPFTRSLMQIKEDSELKIISSRGVIRAKSLPTTSASSLLKKKLKLSSKILKRIFTRRER
ncbi:hypothetical protein DOY81_007651 [Sarcophaga bullata]|nr:hypothetical protein DOY81_007651 [Sarcophaga bullata]